jgi:hypothetical protein
MSARAGNVAALFGRIYSGHAALEEEPPATTMTE